MSNDLCVRDLHKSYGEILAVNGVSLDAAAGEILGLLGPNGAGKTTTLECILGLRVPESGTITVAGIDALRHREKVKRLIGAQLQATALQDKITPREALKFFGAFYSDAVKPSDLLERFSLGDKADEPFDRLSAGQKQRLALALAFVNRPRLIFLDEPTAGLDPQSRRELHEDILKLKSDGCTIVLSTHYIEEAHRLCDRIAIINRGKIVAAGSPGALIARAGLPNQVIVKTDPALAEEQLRLLAATADVRAVPNGWQVATEDISKLVISLIRLIETANVTLINLQIQRASLEDAFLKLIGEPETVSAGIGV